MADADPGRPDLRRLALSTIFPGFEGTDAPPPWVKRLAADGLGGVVLYGRNVDPARGDAGVAELTRAIRDAGPDLLVAVDEEGGDVTRLDGAYGSSTPGNAALGAVDDVSLTGRVAAALGARLRRCGIDLNFAPVADVDSNVRNPVIGPRAFGAAPDLVARHTAAFVDGHQRQGVAATAKHFPGHGGTAEDSHLTVPVLDQPLDEVRRLDLPPFRSAIASGVRAVMTAHVLVPAIDPDFPATLSRAAITGLLRDELGFDGVVMTDGLDMDAMLGTVGHAEAGVLAIAGGVDALCVGGDSTGADVVEEMAAALVGAVASGRLPASRLAAAAGRVATLRTWCRDAAGAESPMDGPESPVDEAESPVDGATRRSATEAARRAVLVVGDVRLRSAPLVLELRDEPSIAVGDVPWGIGAPLAARMPGTVVVELHADGPDVAPVLDAHPGRRVVVSARGLRLRPWQVRVLKRARAQRPDLIVIDHDIASPRAALGEHYVLTHGAARVTAEVAADLLAD